MRGSPFVLPPARAPLLASPAPALRHEVTAHDLVVGCVTDDDPTLQQQALRLVQSIRWFGGELAKARLLVCAVDGIADPARRELESYGAEVRVVPRFHPRNGSSNRLRFFEEVEGHAGDILLLDCDIVIVRDPLPLLARGRMQARVAPLPSVTHEVFERLFRHYGIPLPPRHHHTGWTRTPTIPYFNAGVLFGPAELARQLVPVWGRFNRELADRPELAYPCEKHIHQASLSLALASCPVPFDEAPFELNYQLNATHLEPPEGFLALDPAILHYHLGADPEGYLMPPPYPLARLRSEMFNERLREERKGARAGRAGRAGAAARPAPSAPPSQVAVLGMHRGGSSAVTRLLNLAGLAAGPVERFPIPDLANPKGYWENSDVVILDDALLAALGATWSDPLDLDLGRLPAAQREAFEDRARGLIASFDRQGPWLFKDPRLCLLFPFWRNLLTRPVCVLIHRDPLPVARSLEDRDVLPVPLGLALWELHVKAALAGSLGLPRVLVSYHDLMEAPGETLRRLVGELAGLGVEGLREPEEAEVASFLDPALDRHARDPEARRGYLNPAQLELVEALESGAALALDPVPALSSGARDALAAHRFVRAERRKRRRNLDHRDGVIAEMAARQALERREAEKKIDRLDKLLAAVFSSRSWRFGHALSRLLRRFSPSPHPSAFERWQSLRGEPGEAGKD